MRRWLPWLAAFVFWNGAFDLQVRSAGEAFTANQVARWQAGDAPALIRDEFAPRVRAAALRSTAAAGVLLLLGLAVLPRSAGDANR
jgi:hypothetical protein